MLSKLTLNDDWYRKQIEIAGPDKDAILFLEIDRVQLRKTNDGYGFSFLTPHLAMYLQTALRTETPQPFNETAPEDRFELEDYGYAETENEIVEYLQNAYGLDNPDAFVVEVKLIQDYEKLYKHGTFIKNGADTEDSYHCWFNEHGGEPECQYGKSKDGHNVFVHVTIWKKTQ